MLRGTLDDFSLADIFKLLSFSKKTGRVELKRRAGMGRVYFRDGDVLFAESSLSREPLGQKLIRARALSETHLRRALDEHADTGERVGQILLRERWITLEQLETAVRQQIEDAVFDLLRWELGEFEWEPGATLEPEVAISVSVENLIMEASRRLDELEIIGRKVPSPQVVVAVAPTPPEGAVEINITPDEWRVLVLVDGHRSVETIANTIGLDEFHTMKIVHGMVSAGLVEVVGHEDPGVQPAREGAVAVAGPPDVVVPPPPPPPPPVHEVLEAAVGAAEEVAPVTDEETPADAYEMDAPVPEPIIEQDAPADAYEMDRPLDEPISGEDASADAYDVDAPVPEPITEQDAPADAYEMDAPVPEPITGEEARAGAYEMDAPVAEPIAGHEAPADLGADEVLEETLFEAPFSAPNATETSPPEEWFADPDLSMELFDSPSPGDLLTELPTDPPPLETHVNGDGTAAAEDLMTEDAVTEDVVTDVPPAPERPRTPPPPPVAQVEGEDRTRAVRELAGLFDDDVVEKPKRPVIRRIEPVDPAAKRRVEDDEQVTKSLISRLIEGVKGL